MKRPLFLLKILIYETLKHFQNLPIPSLELLLFYSETIVVTSSSTMLRRRAIASLNVSELIVTLLSEWIGFSLLVWCSPDAARSARVAKIFSR